MKKILTFIHYSIYVLGVFLLCLIPANKYDWMQKMDSTMTTLPEGGSDNTYLAMVVLTIFLVAMQITRLIVSKNQWEKYISIMLGLVAVLTWFFTHG